MSVVETHSAALAMSSDMPLDETGLVAAAQLGEEPAVRALVRMLNQRLFRIARGIVNSDAAAEDVVQEAYLKGFTKLQEFRGESSFSTWMTRIAINTALMHKRKESVQEEYDTVSEEKNSRDNVVALPGSRPGSTEENYQRAQVRIILEKHMSELSVDFRLPLIMFEVEQMSVAEISQELGVSVLAIKARLSRARRRLRQKMQSRHMGGMSELFPFDGHRCASMADRVVAGLQRWQRRS